MRHPRDTKKWKKIAKIDHFGRLGHFGQMAIFDQYFKKKSKNLSSLDLSGHKYAPKMSRESIPTCFEHIYRLFWCFFGVLRSKKIP